MKALPWSSETRGCITTGGKGRVGEGFTSLSPSSYTPGLGWALSIHIDRLTSLPSLRFSRWLLVTSLHTSPSPSPSPLPLSSFRLSLVIEDSSLLLSNIYSSAQSAVSNSQSKGSALSTPSTPEELSWTASERSVTSLSHHPVLTVYLSVFSLHFSAVSVISYFIPALYVTTVTRYTTYPQLRHSKRGLSGGRPAPRQPSRVQVQEQSPPPRLGLRVQGLGRS